MTDPADSLDDEDTITCDMCCGPIGPGVSHTVDDTGLISCRWCIDPEFTPAMALAEATAEYEA